MNITRRGVVSVFYTTLRCKSSKSSQLRTMLNSNQLEFIMEAHSGLSAKIVEEAGMLKAHYLFKNHVGPHSRITYENVHYQLKIDWDGSKLGYIKT